MKQTIEIEVPDGKRAVWKDNKIIFEDIKPQLPKTWEEFCKQNKIKDGECYLNYVSEIKEVPIRERLAGSDRIVLPNKQAAEAHLALMRLHQLRDCYRQGWKPDWEDGSYKYGIKWGIIDGKIKLTIAQHHTYDSDFLLFPTWDLVDEFLTNFRDLIEKAGDLI